MNTEEIASAAFFDQYAIQHVDEFRMLLYRVAKLKPHRVVEVGVAQGGTFFAWMKISADDATIVGVDLVKDEVRHQAFEENFGIRDSRGSRAAVAPVWSGTFEVLPRLRMLKAPAQQISIIYADSTALNTVERVKHELGGDADFVFIDGGHDEATVRADWKNYGALARVGGIIAFHDIKTPLEHSAVGIVWDEIRAQYAPDAAADVTEYCARDTPFGIGLVTVTNELQNQLRN